MLPLSPEGFRSRARIPWQIRAQALESEKVVGYSFLSKDSEYACGGAGPCGQASCHVSLWELERTLPQRQPRQVAKVYPHVMRKLFHRWSITSRVDTRLPTVITQARQTLISHVPVH